MKWKVSQNGMPLQMECHSKWNVTLNGNVTKNGISFKNGMSLKMECHSKWNKTLNGMSPKVECH